MSGFPLGQVEADVDHGQVRRDTRLLVAVLAGRGAGEHPTAAVQGLCELLASSGAEAQGALQRLWLGVNTGWLVATALVVW